MLRKNICFIILTIVLLLYLGCSEDKVEYKYVTVFDRHPSHFYSALCTLLFARHFTLKISTWAVISDILGHIGYITFQMAEVAIDMTLFAEILFRIERLRCYSV